VAKLQGSNSWVHKVFDENCLEILPPHEVIEITDEKFINTCRECGKPIFWISDKEDFDPEKWSWWHLDRTVCKQSKPVLPAGIVAKVRNER